MRQIRKEKGMVIISVYILYREAVSSRRKKAEREELLKHHLLKAMPHTASEGLENNEICSNDSNWVLYTKERDVTTSCPRKRFSGYFRKAPEAFCLICSCINKGGK